MASPFAKLGQNLNVAGVSLFMRVVLVRSAARFARKASQLTRPRSAPARALLQGGQAPLALPHVSVQDITSVDWHALRAAGFVGCVFDKARPSCSACRLRRLPRLTPEARRTTR